MLKRLAVLACAVVLAGTLGACSAPSKSDTPVKAPEASQKQEIVHDSLGNEFKAPMNIKRAVVLNSSAYDIIKVLGKEDAVIGVSDSIHDGAASGSPAAQKENLGNWRKPNVEKILDANPDVVFGYGSWLDSGIAQQLKDAGVPVIMVGLYMPSKILDEVKFMGKILGAEKRANEFCSDIEQQLNLVKKRVQNEKHLKAYWEVYNDYKSAAQGSGADEMMTLAGLANMTHDQKVIYPKVSDEWVLQEQPEIIIKALSDTKHILGPNVTDDSKAKEACQAIGARPGWDALPAIKNHKVVLLSSRISTSPLGLAVTPLVIAKTAYPDKFKDVDPEKTIKTFLKKYWNEDTNHVWMYQANK